MGLDNFARPCPEGELSAEDLAAFEKADIQLCGGVFSGGNGSFNGKVYFELVYDITGTYLNTEWIPPEEVTNMYEKLKFCHLKDFPGKEQDILELRKFFKVCVQRHLGLAAWW